MSKVNAFKDFLLSIFTHLEHCNFDKAKELSKKEKDFSNVTSYREILTVVSRFIEAERCYLELNYLNNKERILLRRDHSLQYIYDAIREDLSYIQESNNSNEVTAILNDLIKFIAIRIKLIDLYDSLYMLSLCNKHIKFEDLSGKVEAIADSHIIPYSPCYLVKLKNNLRFEIDALHGLLCAQLHLQKWTILSCLINLQAASRHLNAWLKVLQAREVWKPNFLRANNNIPQLYHWMSQFRAFLLDKFSLYFYMLFRQDITVNELKNVCNKHRLDHIKKFQELTQYSNPGEMCIAMLVFDACGLKNWHGPGYHYVSKKDKEQDITNNSYYIMMRHPEKLSQPCMHLPAIKRIILEHYSELLFLDRVVCSYLEMENCTYFIMNVEERTSLVVYYDSKRDNESEISSRVLELAMMFRCHRLFNKLKTTPPVK